MTKASHDPSEAQWNTPGSSSDSIHLSETSASFSPRHLTPPPNLQSERSLDGADPLPATSDFSTVTPPMDGPRKDRRISTDRNSPTSERRPSESLARSASASSIRSPSRLHSKRTREAAENPSPPQARIRRSKRLKEEEPSVLPANTLTPPILEPPPPPPPPVPSSYSSQISTPLRSGSRAPPSLNRRRVIVSPTLSDFDDEALFSSGLLYDDFEGQFVKPASEPRGAPRRVSGRPVADRSYSWPSLPPRWKKE